MKNIRSEYFRDDSITLSMKTTGKSRLVEDFNVLEEYLERFGEKPFTMKIVNDDIDFFNTGKIRETLKSEFPSSELLYVDNYYSLKHKRNMAKREIWLLDEGYILVMSIDGAETFFNEPRIDIDVDNETELCEFNNILIPNSTSKLFSQKKIDKIISLFERSIIIEKPRPTIGMVAIDNGDLYVKDFTIPDNIKFQYMDLHYGDGFSEFSKKLIKKLKNDKKGLILLHGVPGTGKTHYIRYLLTKLTKENKNILYFPPTMVDTITEPSFVNFINSWVNDNEKSCIVLIEDAEPLLVSRNTDRNIGITNLLNLTDGLLNDIFGIQIIATFNTTLDELDEALLRPERLTARKEFRVLPKERSLELAKKLKIKEDLIKNDMTLADIYSIKKKTETLLHDVGENRKSIGFGK